MSRSWLLYLDDLIASAEKIGRLMAGHTIEQVVADAAAPAPFRWACQAMRAQIDSRDEDALLDALHPLAG